MPELTSSTNFNDRPLAPEGRIVRGEQRLLLDFPVQFFFDAAAADFAQLMPQWLGIEQLEDLLGKVNGVIGTRVKRGVTGGAAAFGEVEQYNRSRPFRVPPSSSRTRKP